MDSIVIPENIVWVSLYILNRVYLGIYMHKYILVFII